MRDAESNSSPPPRTCTCFCWYKKVTLSLMAHVAGFYTVMSSLNFLFSGIYYEYTYNFYTCEKFYAQSASCSIAKTTSLKYFHDILLLYLIFLKFILIDFLKYYFKNLILKKKRSLRNCFIILCEIHKRASAACLYICAQCSALCELH